MYIQTGHTYGVSLPYVDLWSYFILTILYVKKSVSLSKWILCHRYNIICIWKERNDLSGIKCMLCLRKCMLSLWWNVWCVWDEMFAVSGMKCMLCLGWNVFCVWDEMYVVSEMKYMLCLGWNVLCLEVYDLYGMPFLG